MWKKAITAVVMAGVLALAAVGCGSSGGTSSSASASTIQSSSTTSSYSYTYESGPQGDIEQAIAGRITDKMDDTIIDSLIINDDASDDGKYIALVNLTWNVQNSGTTSKKMLAMYSEDLAATVANECPDVSEIAMFWDVPYLNASAKVSYESNGVGMILSDEMWDSVLSG